MELCKCSAKTCGVQVPPRRVFCCKHWAMIPYHTHMRIWDTIKAGGLVSEEFRLVLAESIEEVEARNYVE